MAATAERTTIATTGLTKRYGDVVALDDVSVALADQAIGLLGANGAGKSTLMKALLGLVEPDAGTVAGARDRRRARGRELRRRIGYMPEHDCLPTGMTARDLVVHLAECAACRGATRSLRASEVLFQVGLEEERSRLIGTYSTGMKQRAKLAQALVHAPELVVLDEPTNGLDPAGSRGDARARPAALVATSASACCSPRTCWRTSSAPATRWSCCATARSSRRAASTTWRPRGGQLRGCARRRRGGASRAACGARGVAVGTARTAGWRCAARGGASCSTRCATPRPTPASACARCCRRAELEDAVIEAME